MFELLKGTVLEPEFTADGVSCYSLQGGNYLNRYYVTSEEGTRRLLNRPEVVGYEVYQCLLKTTTQMMRYFHKAGLITSANILSILRGALNYPLEESCYLGGIRVHDISFLSSERVFHHDEIAGLEIKYSKLAAVPDSTLLIGDIIATGDTLVHCLRYVTEYYRKHGAKLRNIVVFTIGGNTGIEIMENLTREIQEFWPDFEGFIAVYYEGIFNTYKDKGVSGINIVDVDFYWEDGIIAPEYRKETLSEINTLFEKCIIYDGGARRYEIYDHIKEVLEFWEGIRERAGQIDFTALVDEKLGTRADVSLEEWIACQHYENLPAELNRELYQQEQEYRGKVKEVSLLNIAEQRIREFSTALKKYMLYDEKTGGEKQ